MEGSTGEIPQPAPRAEAPKPVTPTGSVSVSEAPKPAAPTSINPQAWNEQVSKYEGFYGQKFPGMDTERGAQLYKGYLANKDEPFGLIRAAEKMRLDELQQQQLSAIPTRQQLMERYKKEADEIDQRVEIAEQGKSQTEEDYSYLDRYANPNPNLPPAVREAYKKRFNELPEEIKAKALGLETTTAPRNPQNSEDQPGVIQRLTMLKDINTPEGEEQVRQELHTMLNVQPETPEAPAGEDQTPDMVIAPAKPQDSEEKVPDWKKKLADWQAQQSQEQ
ncbi:MAG TPA: hypothetical protein VEL49_05565 [Ktedonobacteraceae bacterium]|nr:hypothetical protein [Ktedonobacteraceae bacterium]